MVKQINIKCRPEDFQRLEWLQRILGNKLHIDPHKIADFRILKYSIDARGDYVLYNVKLEYSLRHKLPAKSYQSFKPQNVENAPKVFVVGFGPAGMFAALRLIERGFKPVIFERGKAVEDRKKDIVALHRNAGVNPDSNYAYGEGGAGTYSDGKLFTRSRKRGDRNYVLNVLHQYGAPVDILQNARPHIGTDKLPHIIKNIRNAILDAGGEIHYNSRVTDFRISDDKFSGVILQNGDLITGKKLVLASGHSARDMYSWFDVNSYPLEAKSFAVGVRVEHPQELINSIQYGKDRHNPNLPPAEYNFAVQTGGRGVYSFCMCPGGSIVPASTEENAIVVNGMSNSKRNLRWANSGFVTGVSNEEACRVLQDDNVLSGMHLQELIEKQAFLNGGNGLYAPAQRLSDFTSGHLSSNLPESSYSPGLVSSPLHFWLPDFISDALRKGVKRANGLLRGFLTNEAIVVGVETRTSSPVRIPRDKESMEYIGFKGMYPAGEGAGYSGGIVSSAVDGLVVADHIHV
ncbi:MAG: NAD(P)/FAD-dependent oxidoreductase [Bacteroidota bacterium]|nr:NAD(P)/FAD-dependent oxidoreductase [Bacteroidota bacterium]